MLIGAPMVVTTCFELSPIKIENFALEGLEVVVGITEICTFAVCYFMIDNSQISAIEVTFVECLVA